MSTEFSTRSDRRVAEATETGLRFLPGRWIDGWDPEDQRQWTAAGRAIATRNLVISIFAEFLGFATWAIWSIVVPQLPAAGFSLTVDQMFWLVSVPSLVGAGLRIPYTFAVPLFGGRNWTIVSALLLLLPALGLVWVVNNPQTPFSVMLVVAALAGFGGGNFASSMANISLFYPHAEKGRALGINAAGGNIGTAAVQWAVPVIIVSAAGVQLDRAGWMFVPLSLIAAVLAWRMMDNLTVAKSDGTAFRNAARHPHTWVLSFIYIGTFGSFIGYSGAFPTLLKNTFPEVSLSIAFLGALVGSVARPLGGAVADRLGGAVVTIGAFAGMTVGAVGVIAGLRMHSFGLFMVAFLGMFVFTGIGNGSVYRMIAAVYRATSDRVPGGPLAAKQAAAACLGIAGAVGALGGFLIPRGFAISTTTTGSLEAAIWIFIGFYVAMAALTWWCYVRPGSALTAHRV